MSDLNRESVARIVNLVKPALATQDYIPAYRHINFANYATAYNDISAISVYCDLGINRCVPGELLSRSLASLSGEKVMLQISGSDQSLLVASGRSKLKLPTLDPKSFPFTIPDSKGESIVLDAQILKGIEACMISVGNDPTHPAQMGITLDQEDNSAILYSTDNFSISRYDTRSAIRLPGDAPVILPTFFCQQLLILGRAYPNNGMTLYIEPGSLLVDFLGKEGADAILFTKTLVDLEPVDFGKIVRKHSDLGKLKNQLSPIPDAFEASFLRSLLVLDAQMDKAARVSIKNETLKLYASSPMGETEDSMSFDSDVAMEFNVDPVLVLRASKACTHMLPGSKVLILATEDTSFLHLISHSSK